MCGEDTPAAVGGSTRQTGGNGGPSDVLRGAGVAAGIGVSAGVSGTESIR
jgi:hypothetical protein